nr:MAG TPA: hypothetical protein [Caudoviricetes sp.]
MQGSLTPLRPRSQRFHRWFPSQKYNISPKIYT